MPHIGVYGHHKRPSINKYKNAFIYRPIVRVFKSLYIFIFLCGIFFNIFCFFFVFTVTNKNMLSYLLLSVKSVSYIQ